MHHTPLNHIGIYLPNSANKAYIIAEIFANRWLAPHCNLDGLHGMLYSNTIIQNTISEELQHDKYPIATPGHDGLHSMSSGQQRKALFMHIVQQQPDYIILDDLHSNIDREVLAFILDVLNQRTQQTLIIQLYSRKADLLEAIGTVCTINAFNCIDTVQPASRFNQNNQNKVWNEPIVIPASGLKTEPINGPLLQFRNVVARYGEKTVIRHLDWTVNAGELWQLTGPNGSGKSTLLAMITGDHPGGYGQDIELFGRKKGSGESIWDIKKQIGYFTPNMTVQFKHNDTVENMIISGLVDSIGLYRKPTDLQLSIARAWQKVLGEGFSHKKFNDLSFGQQRLLMIVRAVVKLPPLLILDEPTVGLDDENTALFYNLMHAITAQHQTAIVFVSHRAEPALAPHKILELYPTEGGSTSITYKNTKEPNQKEQI